MAEEGLVGALERLIAGGVGITTRALADSHPEVEITLPQWRALVIVASGDGARVGEIARRLGRPLPTTSRMVRRLERRGLVTTARDESDRRATKVVATTLGWQVWRDIVARRRQLIAAALVGLPGASQPSFEAHVEAVAEAFAHLSGRVRGGTGSRSRADCSRHWEAGSSRRRTRRPAQESLRAGDAGHRRRLTRRADLAIRCARS